MSLAHFVRDIHDKNCRFQLSVDEVKDLEDVVSYVVRRYIPETLRILPGCWNRFSIAEIVNAGSYFEQTKIKHPDEFDFMVVVKELSEPESIEISKGCKPGYVNVKATDENRWGKTQDRQTAEKSFEIAILGFNAYLRKALELTKDMQAFQGRKGKLIFKSIVARGKPYKTFSHVQTAYFRWQRNCTDPEVVYDRTGRGYTIYSRTGNPGEEEELSSDENSLDVDIDFMTCCHVEYDKLEEYIKVRPKAKHLLSANGFHLVLKSCDNNACVEEETDCRLVSYTKSEQQRMRDLHTSWKTVYKVLKWVFGYSENIDTYKLKSTVLLLSENKPATQLDHGIIEIVKYLSMCSSKNHMTSYFNESLNVWNISKHFDQFEKWKLRMLLEILQTMQTTPISEYKFNEFMDILFLWVVEMHTAPNITPLSDLQRGFDNSPMDVFNVQGNTFLDIVRKMSPALSKHSRYSWLDFRMKAVVLREVILFLFQRLYINISNCFWNLFRFERQ